jgi:hypothetical protein
MGTNNQTLDKKSDLVKSRISVREKDKPTEQVKRQTLRDKSQTLGEILGENSRTMSNKSDSGIKRQTLGLDSDSQIKVKVSDKSLG